jgi:hypothetical protein
MEFPFEHKQSVWQKALTRFQWPHRQTRLERTAHLVNHLLIYGAFFVFGYLVAHIQGLIF